LTDWYDSPEHWERALRGEEKPYELTDVCVSVLGASNVAWLRTMPTDAVTGGFMPRFVLFDAPDKRFWKARPRFDERLGRELSATLAVVASTIPETIGFSDAAGDYLDEWYERDVRCAYEATGDEQFRAWLARKQAAAMKLAAVWQLADGGDRDVIHTEWLTRARKVVDWGDACVEQVYGALGVTQEGLVAMDVQRVLREAGGRMTRRQICKRLQHAYTASRVQGAINTLRHSGDIKAKRSPTEGLVWELTSSS